MSRAPHHLAQVVASMLGSRYVGAVLAVYLYVHPCKSAPQRLKEGARAVSVHWRLTGDERIVLQHSQLLRHVAMPKRTTPRICSEFRATLSVSGSQRR